MGFMDLEKGYDRINREELWQVLRMYDVGGKLLNGIKSMYVYNSGVRQGCTMSPWLYSVYMDAVMKKVEMGMGRRRVRFQERRKWRLLGL